MKQILVLSFLSICCIPAFAQHEGHSHEAVSTTNESKIAAPDTSILFKEESFDFGKIPQGKPVHHNFEFKNTGNKPMKLVNVQASCGCTTPEWEKDKEILPNAASSINVGYNAAAEGPFTKNITVTYNDNQMKIISIKGEVWKTPSASAPANASTNDLKD